MPRPRRDEISIEISRELANISNPFDMLPMPHKTDGTKGSKVSCREWEEYRQRNERYQCVDLNYSRQFSRPSRNTVTDVWKLLVLHIPDKFERMCPDYGWLTAEEKLELEYVSRQALIIVLDAFVIFGLNRRNISYNTVFDALCRKYSDHYRWSIAKAARDMREDTIKKCRRDLLLNGIDANKLWDLVVAEWSNNPLFNIDRLFTGKGEYLHVILDESSMVLKEFQETVGADLQYARTRSPGINALFAHEKFASNFLKHEICAEVLYNEAKLGSRSERLLQLQHQASLLLDVDAFNDDYHSACIKEEKLCILLKESWGIDPCISNTKRWRTTKTGKKKKIWSRREEHLYYRAIEKGLGQAQYDQCILFEAQEALRRSPADKWKNRLAGYLKWLQENGHTEEIRPPMEVEKLVQAAIATRAWQQEARSLLNDYDRARHHKKEYRHVYEQVRDKRGYLPIRSGFFRTINRRYQPLHFWPTYVSSRSDTSNEVISEKEFKSYRKRWFKAYEPEASEAYQLIGLDISSSQMQIIATFLGIETLEKASMVSAEIPLKEVMAERAWERHCDPNDEFRFRKILGAADYEGPKDKRLQELIKVLLMRVSYGSTPWAVVNDQNLDPGTYGPGWTVKSASLFLEDFYREFPGVETFLQACCRIAEITYRNDPYAGVTFTDPYDGAIVRWNPVARGDVTLGNNGHKLTVSLPGKFIKGKFRRAEPNLNQEYPVELEDLKKMIAPCLVHMLDAFFSSLVMEKLVDKGVTNFVGIHDCWMVPRRIHTKGAIYSGETILREAMEEVAEEWYLGLGIIYKDLLKYLKDDSGFSEFVHDAQEKWKKRVEEGYRPAFLAKPS
jgi:hypothetical protein